MNEEGRLDLGRDQTIKSKKKKVKKHSSHKF